MNRFSKVLVVFLSLFSPVFMSISFAQDQFTETGSECASPWADFDYTAPEKQADLNADKVCGEYTTAHRLSPYQEAPNYESNQCQSGQVEYFAAATYKCEPTTSPESRCEKKCEPKSGEALVLCQVMCEGW